MDVQPGTATYHTTHSFHPPSLSLSLLLVFNFSIYFYFIFSAHATVQQPPKSRVSAFDYPPSSHTSLFHSLSFRGIQIRSFALTKFALHPQTLLNLLYLSPPLLYLLAFSLCFHNAPSAVFLPPPLRAAAFDNKFGTKNVDMEEQE